MPWGARNNPASPRAHPTANAKRGTVRGKPSRSKPILPSEQNCFHSCTPALPSLSVFCLINYRACMIFFFRVKKKKKKENQRRMPFFKTPPAFVGSHGFAAPRRLPPPPVPAGPRRCPAPPHTDVGFPRAPGAALGKAKPATVLSQLCQEHHLPAGPSPASRTVLQWQPWAVGSTSSPAPSFLSRKDSR